MAPIMKQKRLQALRTHKNVLFLVELAAFLVVIAIFVIKVGSYLNINVFSPSDWASKAKISYETASYDIGKLKYFGSCTTGQVKVEVGQEYLCREPAISSNYVSMYDSAPRDPNGSEVIYPSLNATNQSSVDALLKSRVPIDGYAPYTEKTPDWSADPYHSDEWRRDYYSLNFLIPLINSVATTRDPAQTKVLVGWLDSFTTSGIQSANAWDDPYTAALRTMVLTNAWWKLRSINALPITTSSYMLSALEQHGRYLSDSAHYDSRYGHGTDEAAALLVLGTSMPFIQDASQYKALGTMRSQNNFMNATDKDGALTYYSPSYQLEALAKYWDVSQYFKKNKLSDMKQIEQRMDSMINYSTYILQPNAITPIINSSRAEQIRNNDEYAQIGAYAPTFEYAITQGKHGKKPAQNSVQFQNSGQTIFRSSWNGANFSNETQADFTYSPYSSNYNLPASLALTIYSAGQSLITSPGVHPTQSSLDSYFDSTASQNTVTVDGQSQRQGTSQASQLITKNGYTMQSASNQLNSHVTQKRQVIMLSSSVMVVIDDLTSNDSASHTFEQKFTFAPGMKFFQMQHGAVGVPDSYSNKIEIQQIGTDQPVISNKYDVTDGANPGGICVASDGSTVGCHQLISTGTGSSYRFVTMIKIGDSANVSSNYKDGTLSVGLDGKKYSIDTSIATGGSVIDAKASDPKPVAPAESIIDPFENIQDWTSTNGTVSSPDDKYMNKPSISLMGSASVMTKAMDLDLSSKNLLLRMKVLHPSKVASVDITLESGTSLARLNLMNAYKSSSTSDPTDTPFDDSIPLDSASGWSSISLAKGMARNQQGQWSVSDPNFSWSSIDRVNLSIASNDGSVQTVLFSQFSLIPGQTKPAVSIIFDDGSSTILPAADYMNEHNMQGSVAVIGKYSSTQLKGYLNVAQLHQLKDHDWSLVNHSYYHVDGPATYSNNGNLPDFQTDLLMGAQFLEENDLDTDPNWYVYPHGTTSPALQSIVGKYYKFARTEQTGPETYPFGSPLAVKDFVVFDTTTLDDVKSAVADAITYNQTLILTFHRIHSDGSDKSGYDFDTFKQIIDYLSASKTPVLSLNALDAQNGVSTNRLSIRSAQLPQIKSNVSIHYDNVWEMLKGTIHDIMNR